MNLKSLAFVLSSILSVSIVSNTALAELTLPSGTDRRPNLSLDPFERAREALRKLPQAEEKKQDTEPAPREKVRTAPPIESVVEEQTTQHDSLETAPAAEEPSEAFSYEFAITVDAMSVTTGGNPNPEPEDFEQNLTGVFGVVDFVAELDTGAANLWDNGSFFLYTALAFGAAPAVGDVTGISGVYAGANTMRIIEAWYEHSFPHSHSSFLIGWNDFNNEFYVSEYASLFMNGALGSGQVITGIANPSSYPNTTLGFRYKSELTENSYFLLGMYDGTFPDETLNKLIEVGLSNDDGAFVIAETGYLNGNPGAAGYLKIGMGAYYLRKTNYGFDLPDIDAEGEPIKQFADNPKPHNYGIYVLTEASIGDNLGLFFKHGRAPKDYNQFDQFYAAGLNYKGIIPGREEDVLGIAMVHTRQSDAYLLAHNNAYFIAETTFEITYTTQITEWLMIQPDIQYIQQPSMDPGLANTTVIGIQAQAVF